MRYEVLWKRSAIGDLEKLDKKISRRITDKILTHLTKDPLELGVALRGEFAGLYRYRVDKWRVIYSVAPKKELIIVLRIEHRATVYER
jgi:mRNA interferase RelE/StbE